MIIELFDWRFQVDQEATQLHTEKNAGDHCTCAYCRNYYEALTQYYPDLCNFLSQFGIHPEGPSELMPFMPTLILACYRIHGKILQWGHEQLYFKQIPVIPEAGDGDTFFLWIGEIQVPWLQDENMDEVISPANLPEFMERMQQVWLQRHGDCNLLS